VSSTPPLPPYHNLFSLVSMAASTSRWEKVARPPDDEEEDYELDGIMIQVRKPPVFIKGKRRGLRVRGNYLKA